MAGCYVRPRAQSSGRRPRPLRDGGHVAAPAMSDPHADVVAALEARGVDYEVMECDPDFADTAAFCEKYGISPDESANTILVVGKSEPRRYVACVVLATTRLDVNGIVRQRLGVKKASFASADETRDMTGMLIGGVTPDRSARRHPDLGRRRGDEARVDRARRRRPVDEAANDPGRARVTAERRGRRRPGQAHDLISVRTGGIVPRVHTAGARRPRRRCSGCGRGARSARAGSRASRS